MLSLLKPHTYKAPLPVLSDDFYEFREREDELAALLLARHIWKLLKKARHRLSQLPGCEGGASSVSVLLPHDFLNRLTRDLVRMTEGEPHGVRGCTLQIDYYDNEEVTRIGKIKCDPHLSSASYLQLVLSRSANVPRTSNPLLRIFGYGSDNMIYISPGYTLEKKRLKPDKRVSA